MGWYEENIELNSDFYVGEKKEKAESILDEFFKGVQSEKPLQVAKCYGRMELYRDLGYLHQSTFILMSQDIAAKLEYIRSITAKKRRKEQEKLQEQMIKSTRTTTVVEAVKAPMIKSQSHKIVKTFEFVIPTTIIEKNS